MYRQNMLQTQSSLFDLATLELPSVLQGRRMLKTQGVDIGKLQKRLTSWFLNTLGNDPKNVLRALEYFNNYLAADFGSSFEMDPESKPEEHLYVLTISINDQFYKIRIAPVSSGPSAKYSISVKKIAAPSSNKASLQKTSAGVFVAGPKKTAVVSAESGPTVANLKVSPKAVARSETRASVKVTLAKAKAALGAGNLVEARRLFRETAEQYVRFLAFSQGTSGVLKIEELGPSTLPMWGDLTDSKHVFNSDEISKIDILRPSLKSEDDLVRLLTASLLLANGYYEAAGPDVSGTQPELLGEMTDFRALNPDDFEKVKRVTSDGVNPTASETNEYVHRPTGNTYIVKFLGQRVATELLGRWWFSRLGYSTIDTKKFTIDGQDAVLMKKVDGVVTLSDYLSRQLVVPEVFNASFYVNHLFHPSMTALIKGMKLADVVIELRDEHLRNVLLRVDQKGELLPSTPVIIDRELSFGFYRDYYGGSGVNYRPPSFWI